MLSVDIFEHHDVVTDPNRWLWNDAPWNCPSVPPGATGVGRLEKVSDLESCGGSKRPESIVWVLDERPARSGPSPLHRSTPMSSATS